MEMADPNECVYASSDVQCGLSVSSTSPIKNIHIVLNGSRIGKCECVRLETIPYKTYFSLTDIIEIIYIYQTFFHFNSLYDRTGSERSIAFDSIHLHFSN